MIGSTTPHLGVVYGLGMQLLYGASKWGSSKHRSFVRCDAVEDVKTFLMLYQKLRMLVL